MSTITVSGSAGSGALEIARRVAEGLNLDYVDREILAEAARTLGVTVAAVEHRDETAPPPTMMGRLASLFEKFLERSAVAGAADPLMGTGGLEVLMATSYGEAAALPERGAHELSDASYKEAITSIIGDLAARGNFLIVGRGGQAILRDRPDCIHILVTAPLEWRVRRVMQRDGVDEEEAKHRVHEGDKGRADYHHKYFKVDPNDPHLYDITLNTGLLPIDEAVGLTRAFYLHRFPKQG
jgi:cytidylate kinase